MGFVEGGVLCSTLELPVFEPMGQRNAYNKTHNEDKISNEDNSVTHLNHTLILE